MTTAVVVDDSHFMRTVIADMLENGGIDVLAQARDGQQAVEAVAEHEPDVVTMDVEMPRMNGIEAVEAIMAEFPTPVMMLSAHTDEGADATFQALDRGAVDFFPKPGGEISTEISAVRDELVSKVESVARADVSSAGRRADVQPEPTETVDREFATNGTVVIGASTGGPNVVERVVSELPREANLRLLIVQHMPESFTERFAARLDVHSKYDIREAGNGDRIGGGEGLVARGGRHMEVSGYSSGRLRIRLTSDPPIHGVRPAIDVTMETAAQRIDDPLVGVVLTGMGADGAAGIRAIKRVGGDTVAQDEETSSVFGIPARAIETGCVDEVVPEERLADAILATLEATTESQEGA